MKFRVALFFGALMAATALADEGVKTRFSLTLSVAEMTDVGLKRLSTDQVAVLDALVRRDLATQSRARLNDDTPVTRFSQRLTEDERRIAGCTILTEAELLRLDALVERNAAATLVRTLLAPPRFIPSGARLNPEQPKPGPEVHGSLSLSYGWGKGGYSEKTGAMELRFEDPAHRFSLNVGYSETSTKSPFPYRDLSVTPPPVLP